MVSSLFFAAITWPICKFHIFKGYRGKGAVTQLLDISKYIKRTSLYLGYLNRQVFGNFLPLFGAIFIVGIILVSRKWYKNGIKGLPIYVRGQIFLIIAAGLYFVVIAQIGLSAGEASCRHIFIAYSLFTVLLPAGLYGVVGYFPCRLFKNNAFGEKLAAICCTIVLLSVVLISSYAKKQVLFVYEEEKQAVTYAREQPNSEVVVFHKDNGMYDSRIQEFVEYSEVYFASVNDYMTADDDRIANANELLAYISSEGDYEEECFECIYNQNHKITKAIPMWESNGFFKVYLMN